MTRSEEILWERLRARRFHGLKIRRQHAVAQFVLDFYCEDLALAIEIDGRIHDDPEVLTNDKERQAILEQRGIHFLRLPASLVEEDVHAALAVIERHCRFV